MSTDLWARLISGGMFAFLAFQAWKRNDRRRLIDALLICVFWAALWIPESLPVVRYGLCGTALAIFLARRVMFDLVKGTDTHARATAAALLVFAASIIPALSMSPPIPAWAKYLAVFGAVSMMAALVWPLLWITRILFSAHRLSRDLKHHRPPREADEKALGIDLSVLRQREGK